MKHILLALLLACGLAACSDDDLDDHSGRPATAAEEREAFEHAKDWVRDNFRLDTSDSVQPGVIYDTPIRCVSDEPRECCSPTCEARDQARAPGELPFRGQACHLPEINALAIALSTDGLCETMRVKLDAGMCQAVARQQGFANVTILDVGSCVRD